MCLWYIHSWFMKMILTYGKYQYFLLLKYCSRVKFSMFSHWCSWSNNKAKYLIKVTVFLFLLTKFEAKDMEKMPLLNTVWMMKICNFMKYRAFGNICPRKHCVECLISEFPTNVWVFFEIFITVFYCGNKHLLCLNGCDLYLLFSSRSV